MYRDAGVERALDVSGAWLEALMFGHVVAWIVFVGTFALGWHGVAYGVAVAQAGTASLGTTVALRHRALRREREEAR